MQRSYIYSALLHLTILLLLLFGLPTFFSSDDPLTDSPKIDIVDVSVIEIDTQTNIPTMRKVEKKPEKKAPPKPPQKNTDLPKVKPKNAPPKKITKAEPKIEAAKPNITPKPRRKPKLTAKKKPEIKEEKKETKKEEPKKETDPFASVLKSVEEFETSPAEENTEKTEFDPEKLREALTDANSEEYKPGLPMTISEKEAIRQQIMSNWSVQSGAENAEDMTVKLTIELNPDASVKSVSHNNKARYLQDNIYRVMVDSAERAVHKSSPLQGLPAEKYDVKDGWKKIELLFNPSDMF